jgi:hypothetical protein
VKALPSNQAFYEKHKDKGLHFFLVERQGGTLEDITKYAKDRGLTIPIPVGGSDFSNYRGGGGLPYAFVVGPDGKVVWQGSKGYEAVVLKELERIKYPGLGKLEVAAECTKAAEKFAGGDFAGARDEATKVKEKNADNEAAVADAEYIIKRVDDKVAGLRSKIDDAKSKRRYHDALRFLEELGGKGYKGIEAADSVKDEIKDIKKEHKDELKAWDQLEKVIESNEKLKSDADKKKNLIKFYEKNEGTAAAEEAKSLAGAISD